MASGKTRMWEERKERIGVSIKYGCTCSGLVVLLAPMSAHSRSYFFRLEDSLSSRLLYQRLQLKRGDVETCTCYSTDGQNRLTSALVTAARYLLGLEQ